MTQEITIRKDERPVVMRNGLVHWVTPAAADRLRAVLAGQSGHSFVGISELGITINTAEIAGVYTAAEYDELMRIKEGARKCAYGRWHGRKEECDCKRESDRKLEQDGRERERLEREKPLSEEDRARTHAKIKSIGDELRARGVLGTRASVPTVSGPNGRTCAKCPTELAGSLRYYCSGTCIEAAKRDGTYGKEAGLTA